MRRTKRPNVLGWGSTLLIFGWAAGLASAQNPPATQVAKPTAVTEQCANDTCHAALIGHKVMHGPVVQRKCEACHTLEEAREHRFRLANAADKLCTDCHTMQNRTVVHQPVAQGRCTGCHDPHGSEFKGLLVSDPTRGLCLTCHEQQNFSKMKFVHGPVNTGACILCHEPHSAWQPKLLAESPDKLCIGCHAELVPKGDMQRHVHAPVKDNCAGCHDAHASDFKAQLHEPAPDLCFTCHKEMKEALAAAKVVHGAVNEEGGCLACHAPHFSAIEKLQKTTQPQECLSCHDKQIKAADGQMLADFVALLKDNPSHHGPIREGACTACHQPHAADRFRLLVADYPPEFYAPFNIDQYALCFNCHIKEVVLNKDGVGLTRFRDGEQNLHFLHVNQEKGRTCRACHEVHASKNPFHIRDEVPFGTRGWMLEIKFEQTPTGGRCSPGCHAPKEYDHGAGPLPLPTTQEINP